MLTMCEQWWIVKRGVLEEPTRPLNPSHLRFAPTAGKPAVRVRVAILSFRRWCPPLFSTSQRESTQWRNHLANPKLIAT